MISDLLHRIKRKLTKIRLRPIRVFCFHQVSENFDEQTMYREDWMQLSEFKEEVLTLQKSGYIFISLAEAYKKLRRDWFRSKKYAVLTADDGDESLRNILPWLNEQQIPITLFINPAYLDGKQFRVRSAERYLMEYELRQFIKSYPLLTIGSHGWAHIDACTQTEQEFEENLTRSIEYLKKLPNYVPFFAYPYGRCTFPVYIATIKHQVIPLLVKGNRNYNYIGYIDRELMCTGTKQ